MKLMNRLIGTTSIRKLYFNTLNGLTRWNAAKSRMDTRKPMQAISKWNCSGVAGELIGPRTNNITRIGIPYVVSTRVIKRCWK
jgi:hypothetical protein